MKHVVQTFFEDSLADAVTALVEAADGRLPTLELKRIEAMIKNAKTK